MSPTSLGHNLTRRDPVDAPPSDAEAQADRLHAELALHGRQLRAAKLDDHEVSVGYCGRTDLSIRISFVDMEAALEELALLLLAARRGVA